MLPKLTHPGFTCDCFAFELDLIFEEIVFFTQKLLGKIGKHRKAKKKEKNLPQLLLACCRVPLKSYSCLHRGVREVWKHCQVDTASSRTSSTCEGTKECLLCPDFIDALYILVIEMYIFSKNKIIFSLILIDGSVKTCKHDRWA